jgi:hypothetical protein
MAMPLIHIVKWSTALQGSSASSPARNGFFFFFSFSFFSHVSKSNHMLKRRKLQVRQSFFPSWVRFVPGKRGDLEKVAVSYCQVEVAILHNKQVRKIAGNPQP